MKRTLCLVAIIVGGYVIPAHSGDDVAFKSDLAAESKGFSPYGEDVKVQIIQDEDLKENVIQTTFNDASTQAWCQKGMRVDFREAIEWSQFEFVSALVKVFPSAKAIGFLLHDTSGNFWEAVVAERPTDGQWSLSQVSKDMFRFGYNESDPQAAASDPSAPINYMLIYISTEDVNTGSEYTATIKDILLSRNPSQ